MQAFMGLFLFSVLLTTGASLKCEMCVEDGNSCSGPKKTCPAGLDTCMTLVAEGTKEGNSYSRIEKNCFLKEACNLLQPGGPYLIKGEILTIKDVTCKAPSASASLLVLLGLLLLKVLF